MKEKKSEDSVTNKKKKKILISSLPKRAADFLYGVFWTFISLGTGIGLYCMAVKLFGKYL